MRKTLAIALAATFTTASLAYADSVTIKTDPTPTNSIVIKEKQNPDVVIKKKKVVIKDNDPDVTIKSRISID
ncbi:hypothetical protein EON80_05885 [bacterium]|nr:MAG: hypothetical protein EON80_05885 [bacterium]